MLPKEINRIVSESIPAHGTDAVTRAVERATRFGRFTADDIASILQIGSVTLEVVDPGNQIVVDLPTGEVRSFDDYRIGGLE